MYFYLLNAYICTLYISDKVYNFLRRDFFVFGRITVLNGSIFDRSGFIDDYIYASLIELSCVHGKNCKL